jgi:ubiquinol-cytochrome c reductase cytochrome b subunit
MARPKHKLSFYLPRLCLASFLLSLISGLILSFQYRPYGNVLKTVEEISTVIPFGFFIRRFHYGSGELFVILMLIHILDHFIQHKYKTMGFVKWNKLIITSALSFCILFTGFILKGDQEGVFAGTILMNLLGKIPYLGRVLADLFIVKGQDFYFLPFFYHCFLFPIAIVLLLGGHIRKRPPNLNLVLITLLGLFAYSLFIEMPMAIPFDADPAYIRGPWFFLGLQELLRIWPPWLAAMALPLCFFGLLSMLPLQKERLQRVCYYALLIMLFAYALLSIKSFLFPYSIARGMT